MRAQTRYSPVPHNSTPVINWRPWTLRPPYLLTIIFVCILFITILEVVLRSCKPDGCYVFGNPDPDSEHLSVATSFVYKYLPVVFSVSFGLLIAVLHHDSTRMEPWFQLTREEGVGAEVSLLLEYSYMFPPFVLFKSAKLRHYSVFTATFMLVFTNMVLTPITAGLFDDGRLPRLIEHNSTVTSLKWVNKTNYMSPQFSTRYSYLAYSHAWLNGSLPPFTTAEYALAPWAEANSSSNIKSHSSTTTQSDYPWTGPSILYEADLECEEAVKSPIIVEGVGILGYNLTRHNVAQGLYYAFWDSGVADTDDTDLMKRLEKEVFRFDSYNYKSGRTLLADNSSYYNLGIKPWTSYLDSEDREDYKQSMIYIWASAPSLDWNTTRGASSLPLKWTAVYCSPRFYEQPVSATVLMPSGAVLNVTPTADRNRIPTNDSYLHDFFDNLHIEAHTNINETVYSDSFGNIVGFGGLPQTQPSSLSQVIRRFGGSAEALRVRPKYGLSPTGSLPAFALYTQGNRTVNTLFGPENIQEMYRRALKLQFSMLCRDEWINRFSEVVPIIITSEAKVRGYRANEDWFHGLQAGFGMLILLTITLIILLWERRCALDGEPNSLASALSLLQRSPEIAVQLENAEFNPMMIVSRVLARSGVKYRLTLEAEVGPRVEILNGESLPAKIGEPDLGLEEEYREKKGWPESSGSGIFFTTFFLSMLVVIVVLYICIKVMKGIRPPAPPNSFGYKIIFSYLPTLLGFIIEPLLVTLGTHYCMLGPYKSLRRGNARSGKSLVLDYDKSPPHFQIIRSLRASDLILCGLTTCILLSNILAVALSGLFSPMTILSTASFSVEGFREPRFTRGFDDIPALEMHYILSSNLSGEVSRPNWTTNEYYFLPFSPPPMNRLETASATTLGFGASVSCHLVPSPEIDMYCFVNNVDYKTKCPTFWRKPGPSYMATLSVKDTCWPTLPQNRTRGGVFTLDQIMTWTLPASDYFAHRAQCDDTFFAAWAEIPADREHGAKNISMSYMPTLDSAVIRCTSAEKAVRASVTVDAKGNVLDVRDTTVLTPQELIKFYPGKVGELVSSFISTTAQATYEGGQYLTPLSWFNNHLVTLYPHVIRDIKPNITRIPDTQVLPGAFEDIYRRLYAINLRLYASDVMQLSTPTQEITATGTAFEDRVTVNTPMLLISGGIALYALLLLILLYWGPRAGNEVTHSPTCLAAMWSSLYASDAKEICGGIRGPTSDARMKELSKLSVRYSYGRFITADGRNHVGVHVSSLGGSRE